MSSWMGSEIVFPRHEQPKSLENFLKKRFPIGYVRKLFRKSAVRLNGKRSGPKDQARPGDKIHLFIPYEQKTSTGHGKTPGRMSYEILFEDGDLIVINKEAGVAVHEGKGILKRQSLVGMLEAAYRLKGFAPRLVHRIDKETSGLLLIAKNDTVAKKLERQFEEGEVEKGYLALVAGRPAPEEGRIEFPLPGREGKLVQALTLYKVEKEFSQTSLVRVKIKTGRMHQIRLHFARLGHPIVMDDKHGNFAFNKRFRRAYGLKRQFLHASSVAFEYGGKQRRWTAPLPSDLARTLKLLETAL